VTFAERHPLVAFFALAYGFSWGSYYALSGPALFPFGSLLAALVVASVTKGREGLRDLSSRCLRWRVGLRWYAAALLVPVAIALSAVRLDVLLGAPLATTTPAGPWWNLVVLFPMAVVDAPLWEEPGWRGYALPRFPGGRSPLANSLVLGLLLAGWHLPIAVSGGALVVPYLIATIASAVVTNWVYYHAGESALLAIVYHSAANSMGMYFSRTSSAPGAARYFWSLAAANCVAAVVVGSMGMRRADGSPSRPVERVDHP
jgi:hypothetical protein